MTSLNKPSINSKGKRKVLRNIIHRYFLYNEYDDEYQGYEEQGISFKDWRNKQISEENLKPTDFNETINHSSEFIKNKENQTTQLS
jgi:hypothetical protein